MPRPIRDDDGPIERHAITVPIIRRCEVDLRIAVTVDVTRLLRDRHAPTNDEPTGDQLHVFLAARIARVLRAEAYVVALDVSWLDAAFEAWALDPDPRG